MTTPSRTRSYGSGATGWMCSMPTDPSTFSTQHKELIAVLRGDKFPRPCDHCYCPLCCCADAIPIEETLEWVCEHCWEKRKHE